MQHDAVVFLLQEVYTEKKKKAVSCLDVCIIYFISSGCMMNSSSSYTVYQKLLLSNHDIKYIRTIYTRLDIYLMYISRFSLRDKVALRLLKLYVNIGDMVEWCRTLDIRLSDWCYSVTMV